MENNKKGLPLYSTDLFVLFKMKSYSYSLLSWFFCLGSFVLDLLSWIFCLGSWIFLNYFLRLIVLVTPLIVKVALASLVPSP